MSSGKDAIELMEAFVRKDVDVAAFAAAYHTLWIELRDSGQLGLENPYVHRAINTVFTALDDAESPIYGRTLENQADVLWIEVRAVLGVIHGI